MQLARKDGIGRRGVLVGALAAALAPASPTWAQSRIAVVGALMGGVEGDPAVLAFMGRFRSGTAAAGWEDGRNLRIEFRFTGGNADRAAVLASELVGLAPDALLGNTTANALALLRLTSAIPVVFLPVADPLTTGIVQSYARPGGNATGFTNFEPSHTGKWIGYLKEAAPALQRVALIFNPATAPLQGRYYGPAFEENARVLGLEPISVPVASQDEIAATIAALAASPNVGVVGGSDIFMWNARRIVRDAVLSSQIPTIYPFVNYTDDGGLMSYSVDTLDLFYRAGDYVGQILSGSNPAIMPVQSPTVFRLVINLRAATELGLDIPVSLLAVADQVIE